MHRVVLMAALLLAGCAEDAGLPCPQCRDGGVGGGGGGGGAGDLAGYTFCAGTRVAGTCVQAFFEPIANCYIPALPCTIMTDGRNYTNLCWQNGSKLIVSNAGPNHQSSAIFKNGDTTCLEGVALGEGTPLFTLRRGDATLIYDSATGSVGCPDGTHTDIGPMEGGCGILQGWLNPGGNQCAMGPCQ